MIKKETKLHLILTSDSVVGSSLSELFSLETKEEKIRYCLKLLGRELSDLKYNFVTYYLDVLLLFSARFFSCLLTAIALYAC